MAKVWLCFLLVALTAVLSSAQNQELEQQLDPVQQGEFSNDALEGEAERGDREKRLGIIKKIGLKAGLLDLVFGKIDSFIDSKTRFVNELDKQNVYKNEKYFGITYPPRTNPQNNLRPTSSGPPPVDFQVNSAVSLVIPDRLYGNSFTLVTNASKILGDVIYNTADRAQEFADVINSKLENKFVFARKVFGFVHPFLKIKSGGDAFTPGKGSTSGSKTGTNSSSSSSSSSNSISLLGKRDAISSAR